jgi:hypothetical protein
MTMTAPFLLRLLNAIGAAMPRKVWRRNPVVRAQEWVARKALGMGDVRLSFVNPRGQDAVIMPEQVYLIDNSEAVWEDRDLGHPVRLSENPTIGNVPLPTRPAFMVGHAHARVEDLEAYERARELGRVGRH